MRHYLARLLNERYNVQTVPDGQAALAAARRRRPDLVLSDVMMPNLDGFGLVRELRADAALQTVPIILLSARAGEESRVEGLQQGADDYLIKPFSARELMARVAAHLEMARMRKEAAEQIRQSEERFRVIVEGVQDYAIFMLDPEGNVVSWNAGAQRIKGYKAEEIVGRNFSIFYCPEDLDRGKPQRELAAALRDGRMEDEGWRVRKDGSRFWADIVITALRDEAGHLKGFTKIVRDITERKQAEEALRETRDYLDNLFNYANAPIIVWDPQFQITRFNAAFEHLTGRQAKEVLGREIDILFPPESRDESLAHIRRTTSEKQRWEVVEIPILHRNGSVRTVLWNSANVLASDHKTVVATIAQGQDITERKQGEEALREAHERAAWLARFPEENPNPVLRVSAEGTVLYRNPAAGELPGWTCETGGLLGEPFLSLVGRAMAEGREVRQDVELGETSYLVWAVPLPSEHYANLYGRDITDRKRAEEALRQTRDYLDNLFNYANAPIIVWDPQFQITRFNAAFEHLTGRQAKDVLGQEIDLLFPPESREESLAYIRRATSEKRRWEVIEIPILHRNGSVRTVLWNSANVLASDHKTVMATIAQGQDITERKQAEDRLKADLDALTQMHALSTRVLEAGGLEPLLQEIMDAAVAIVGAERGTLQLIEGDSLRIVAHHGHERPFLEFFACAESRASVCGEAMKSGQRVIVEDVECSPLFAGTASLKALRAAGVRAVQSTPLVGRQGALLGILTTQWGVPHVPDEHDQWRLDLLARQAADLIEHKQAEEALRESEGRFRILTANLSSGVALDR